MSWSRALLAGVVLSLVAARAHAQVAQKHTLTLDGAKTAASRSTSTATAG